MWQKIERNIAILANYVKKSNISTILTLLVSLLISILDPTDQKLWLGTQWSHFQRPKMMSRGGKISKCCQNFIKDDNFRPNFDKKNHIYAIFTLLVSLLTLIKAPIPQKM